MADEFTDADVGLAPLGDAEVGLPAPAPKKPAKKEEPIDIGREVSAILSKINEKGIADVLGIPVDLANTVLGAAGMPVSQTPFLGSESIKSGMRSLGMSKEGAEPETVAGKMVAGAGVGATSAVLSGGGLGSAVKGVGSALSSAPVQAAGRQIASIPGNILAGFGGGSTGALAEHVFEGSPGQAAAKIGGELVGGGIAGLVAPRVTRIRPAPGVDPVIAAYERLGLAPSAAEAGVGGRAAQWLEGNILPQTIGGGGVMESWRRQRMSEVTAAQQEIADAFGAARSRFESGKAIQEHVLDRWNTARTALGKTIGTIRDKYATDVLYPSNLIAAVTNPVGAATTKAVRSTTLDPLVLDAAKVIRDTGGNFTMSDLAALKTKFGTALEPGVQKNVDDAQVAQLFNAVRKDMEAHVRSRSPDDFRQLSEANKGYAAAQTAFRQNFKKLIGTKEIPVSSERAYEIVTGAATEKGRGDLAEFRAVWDALPRDERGSLAATIVSRLGALDRSAPGNPETFSLGKFLGNDGYRGLSQEAKDLLFKGTGNAQTAQALDDLVAVAGNIQERLTKLASSSRSGTGTIMLGQFGIGQLFGNMLAGDFTGLLYSIGGPYMAAQLLTKPAGVRMLTKTLQGYRDALDASLRTQTDLISLPKVQPPAPSENSAGISPQGPMAVNDQTGQAVRWDGQQWAPVQ